MMIIVAMMIRDTIKTKIKSNYVSERGDFFSYLIFGPEHGSFDGHGSLSM